MPIYRNNTSKSITSNGATWKPGETKPVSFFVPDEQGLALLSEEPRVTNQALASGTLTLGSGETFRLYIPDCKTFVTTIAVKSGLLYVRENYADNEVFTLVKAGSSYMATLPRWYVEAYQLTNADSGETEIEYHVSRYYKEA